MICYTKAGELFALPLLLMLCISRRLSVTIVKLLYRYPVDVWGVVMRRDSPLARKKSIRPDDLCGLPLICSEQAMRVDIPRWCGEKADMLNFSGTLNLCYNGSIFVKEGLGYMLTFDGLVDTSENSGLCFRPLEPRLETKMFIIWKKYQMFTPIAELLLRDLKEHFS